MGKYVATLIAASVILLMGCDDGGKEVDASPVTDAGSDTPVEVGSDADGLSDTDVDREDASADTDD